MQGSARHDTVMRVLVAEDSPEMRSHLKQGLGEHGYTVDVVSDGEAALAHAATGAYDLLILDRSLPRFEGVAVLRQLRAQGNQTPCIFVTARGSVGERVEGLDAGGDDYLVKPFSFAELLARIRAIGRRGSESQSAVLQVADLRLDPVAMIVERAGRRLDLTAKQFVLLSYMMRHAGQVVSRAMLLEHVWNFEFDGLSNVVDVHINRLRGKVDRGFDAPLIHTLRGLGYVLREP